MRVVATIVLLAVLGGCAMSREETLEETRAELVAVLDGVIEATDLPVTRRRDDPGLFLSCQDGGEQLTAKVNADDPPELEPLAEAVIDHLESEGWRRTGELPIEGEGGDSLSVFLARDGFEVIVDIVRGSEGTGVDVEVLSPCREMEGPG